MQFIRVRAPGSVTILAFTIALAGCQASSMTAPPPMSPAVLSQGVHRAKVTPFVTGLTTPVGIVFDKAGNFYIAQQSSTTLLKVSPTGKKTSFGSGLSQPLGLAIDSAGNIYVGDASNNRIAKITPAGKTTTLAKGFSVPWALAVDASGNVYVSDYTSKSYKKVSPTGKVTTFIADFMAGVQGIALDKLGNAYVSGGFTNPGVIQKYSPAGKLTKNIKNTIQSPLYDAVDGAGNVYVGNGGHSLGVGGDVWKITPNGVQTNIATKLTTSFLPAGFALRNGAVYVSDQNGSNVYKIVP